MIATAQQIADAVLAEVEGEDLLIEAMARALCKICWPDMADASFEDEWPRYRQTARIHLVCDRVMRGPGDQVAYERLKRIADFDAVIKEED